MQNERVNLGLDIGGSTTKVVGFRGAELLVEAMVTASDPLASAYGGLGKFLNLNKLKIADLGRINMTGVGASYVKENLFDVPTYSVDEFVAVGLGGLYASGVPSAIVVSMGTGTSIVLCEQGATAYCEHVIGSGIGGGTLMGLANRLLNIRDFSLISQLAETGDLHNIDLSIGDISAEVIAGLDWDTTASNFGKLADTAKQDDLALGLVNLVFQPIGTSAVLAARLKQQSRIIFIGSMLRVQPGHAVLAQIAKLYGVEIIIPAHAEYATAIGAALSAQSRAAVN